VDNRADAARGKTLGRDDVRVTFVFITEFSGGVVLGCKLEEGRYGGRRSGSWLRHRFTAVAQVRAWRAGSLRIRRRKAAEPELLVAAQAVIG